MDAATQQALTDLYPTASRAEDAARFGYKRSMLDHICSGRRKPSPGVAQRISVESGGRLTVARLCGWERTTRPPGCRVFDDDPMPLARALGDEPFRDRDSDRGAIRYLQSMAPDCPPDVCAAIDVVLRHFAASDRAEESAP